MPTDDPDENLTIPRREIRAALALADSMFLAMQADKNLADRIADLLPALRYESLLPEVGPIKDGERLRLHLYHLAKRLRSRLPGAPAAPAVESDETKIGTFSVRPATRAHALEGDDLVDAFVWWDDVSEDDINELRTVLEAANDERPLQRYLATNPLLLVQHLGGGHGRWVLSQKRLGSEFVTDFVIGERSSDGFEWQFVELQSPKARLFVPSSGRQSEQLDEGIRQILEWRRWLDDNRDYARRPRSRNGLGLFDASGLDPGLLLIGRATNLSAHDRSRRRQLSRQLNIQIHTYDWIVRQASNRVRSVQNPKSRRT
jgi:hypothetical protein